MHVSEMPYSYFVPEVSLLKEHWLARALVIFGYLVANDDHLIFSDWLVLIIDWFSTDYCIWMDLQWHVLDDSQVLEEIKNTISHIKKQLDTASHCTIKLLLNGGRVQIKKNKKK